MKGRILIAGALGLMAIGLLRVVDARSAAPLLLIKESHSLPRGLYRRTSGAVFSPGAIVALVPPASARPRLLTLGYPPGQRLLKRIAAAPGAEVCARETGLVAVDGLILEVPPLQNSSGVWSGCRRLGPDQWLVQGETARSFDSRSFGPVSTAALEGPYRLVQSW